MNPLAWIDRKLNAGWFSRLVLISILAYTWRMVEWAQAFAGTALAMEGPKDLMGCAAVIGSVGVLPTFIMTWGLNAYTTLRAQQPRVIDRRQPDG